MSARVAGRLAVLRPDYEQVKGQPFHHFFCPVLYRDDPAAELCEAHIVNRAFGASSTWTVQRKDVDSFFGSAFESDFVVLKHRGRTAAEAIADQALAKQFRPSIVADGKPIEFYAAKRPVPKDHSRMILTGSEGETNLVLKMPPEDVAALMNARWGIQIERDIRVPAMVSLLKAAHLTLFHMLGYQYVFSAGGRFLGYDILGKFFLETAGRAKTAVVAAAHPYFREFVHMMRPMPGAPEALKGTADDQMVYICERGTIRWGMIVVIRTSPTSVHAVLAPLFEGPLGAKVFLDFLRGSEDEQVTARAVWFRGDKWEGAPETVTHHWPKSGILYPEEPIPVGAPA